MDCRCCSHNSMLPSMIPHHETHCAASEGMTGRLLLTTILALPLINRIGKVSGGYLRSADCSPRIAFTGQDASAILYDHWTRWSIHSKQLSNGVIYEVLNSSLHGLSQRRCQISSIC